MNIGSQWIARIFADPAGWKSEILLFQAGTMLFFRYHAFRCSLHAHTWFWRWMINRVGVTLKATLLSRNFFSGFFLIFSKILFHTWWWISRCWCMCRSKIQFLESVHQWWIMYLLLFIAAFSLLEGFMVLSLYYRKLLNLSLYRGL